MSVLASQVYRRAVPISSLQKEVTDLFLALLSVFLFFLSFPGGGYPWLAWLAMTPLGVAIHQQGTRYTFMLSACTALLAWMAATWWVVPGIAEVSYTSINVVLPFQFLFCLFYALPYAVAGLLYSRLGWTGNIAGAFKGAMLWTAISGLIPHILPGNIAHSQYVYPASIQIVELGGLPLLFFVIHWFSFLIVVSIVRWRGNTQYALKAAALALMLPVLVVGYGEWRLVDVERQMADASTPALNVAWVQPNIATDARDREGWEKEAYEVAALTDQLLTDESGVDLVIWPEIPPPVSYAQRPFDRQLIDQLMKTHDVPMLVTGFHTNAPAPEIYSEYDYYNVVEYITSDGLSGVYRKQRLLPFGEYVPGEESFPILRTLFPGVSRYVAGGKTKQFKLNGNINLLPVICYEAVFPALVRDVLQTGANVLVNPVNDAWFGHTSGADVHLALALFRTVEFRVPLVRVANSGISAVVSASGKIIEGSVSSQFERTTGSARIKVPDIETLYSKIGNSFLWLSALLSLCFIFCQIRNQRRTTILQTHQ